jgi:hypothetical protein
MRHDLAALSTWRQLAAGGVGILVLGLFVSRARMGPSGILAGIRQAVAAMVALITASALVLLVTSFKTPVALGTGTLESRLADITLVGCVLLALALKIDWSFWDNIGSGQRALREELDALEANRAELVAGHVPTEYGLTLSELDARIQVVRARLRGPAPRAKGTRPNQGL